MKWAVAVICAYEVTAITSGKVPTVTELCRRYPDLSRVMVGGLAMHLNDH